MAGFEGSYLGHGDRILPNARLECGVCWWVYDPAKGDAVWQIPAGTTFASLPGHWRCPSCDAPQSQFMVLEAGKEGHRSMAGVDDTDSDLAALRGQLLENYGRVAGRMRGLPVFNAALDLDVPAICESERGAVAVLCTPWCMNLVLFAADRDSLSEGSTREHTFPSGAYAFTATFVEGIGAFEACSLFSPMERFDDPEAVKAVARAALEALLRDEGADGDRAEAGRERLADPGRRRLFGLPAGA